MTINWKKLYEDLNAVPEGKRRLAWGAAWDYGQGCGCILGTLVPKEAWPMSFSVTFGVDLGFLKGEATEAALAVYGITTRDEVRRIERENDQFTGRPEARFEHMLAWFKKNMEETTS